MQRFAIFLLLLVVFIPSVVLAQLGGAKPFGGMIYFSFFCNASNNFLLFVGPPRGTQYWGELLFYDPARTDLREYRQIAVGVWLLGLFRGNARCRIYTPIGPVTIARGKLITLTGTSLGGGTVPGDFEVPDDLDDIDDFPVEPDPSTTTPESQECDSSNLSGWNFNPGIRAQVPDASAPLKTLLGCMCTKLREQNITGTITSISDSDYIGRLYVCQDTSTRTSRCDHGITSCHYGGNRRDNKSYGADIGLRVGASAVMNAATACGASSVRNEGNHIHVAVPECRE